MQQCQFSGPIASAVGYEIERIARTGNPAGEGTAYKAAWDRAGSSALKHCESFRRDAFLTALCVTHDRRVLSPLTDVNVVPS